MADPDSEKWGCQVYQKIHQMAVFLQDTRRHLFRMLPLLKVYNDLITAVASREGKLSWKSLMYSMAAFDRDLTRGGPLHGRLWQGPYKRWTTAWPLVTGTLQEVDHCMAAFDRDLTRGGPLHGRFWQGPYKRWTTAWPLVIGTLQEVNHCMAAFDRDLTRGEPLHGRLWQGPYKRWTTAWPLVIGTLQEVNHCMAAFDRDLTRGEPLHGRFWQGPYKRWTTAWPLVTGTLQEVDHCTPFVFPAKYKVPSYASSCVFRKSKPIYSTFTAMAVHATPGELRVFLTIFSCLSFRTKLNFSLFDGNLKKLWTWPSAV